MAYFFHTDDDRSEMLAAIGQPSVQALLDAQVPPECRFDGSLSVPPALDEISIERQARVLAQKNCNAGSHVCFLGGGAYDHFIPAVVDAIAGRGEFYTSYTPYQAEVSQGNLQVTFEYGSLICELTGLDVSNASLYDGGSATVEAVLMAMGTTRRNRVVVYGTVHPEYRAIVRTYLEPLGGELVEVPHGGDGTCAIGDWVDDQTACVVVQSPNFFGRIEKVESAAAAAHQCGALLVHAFNPISLGVLRRPGDLGADIAVAEGQSLGNPLAYGGPYLGIIACRESLMRRMPGRIAGQTTDRRGRRCWVLTLQTREQHIRREKATSNICTNQGLLALRATIYLSLLGPEGLRETAEHCLQKTAYAKQQCAAAGVEVVMDGPVFNEFVVRCRGGGCEPFLARQRGSGLLAGIPLGTWFPELEDCLLIAITEKRTREEIDRLVTALAE